ncbi:MAG: GspE/PulE family protein [Anaerolineae bacterium]
MVDMVEQIISTQQKQLSILIVDDDLGMCETLCDILEDKGFAVGTANDGQSAVDRMKNGHFDLVLIDVMMPGMNGVETLRQIRAVNPNVTTMIMTGHSQLEGFVSDALWNGVDGVLYKPFDVDAVLQMIQHKSKGNLDTPVIDLRQYQVDAAALKLVPEEMARKYLLLPLRVENGHLLVAMVDPGNLYAIEDLRVRTSLRIKPLKASRADIDQAHSQHYQQTGEIERQVGLFTPVVDDSAAQAAEELSAEAVSQTPVVRAVELMLTQAVKDGASDIHLEPQEDHLRVRYRIDGVLHDTMRLPLRVHAPLISRIKVLANLNIAERRRPQDGQISMTFEGRSVDFRVATINTIHGEMAVLRVLDKLVSVRGLAEIGFLPDMLETWNKLIHSPWGIILISGPTGSGKSTTLYASINTIDKDEQKIITIEDPVEYRFGAISQMQVNRQAGITFATGLRAAMRLDPDVILVGEIRDQETAATAVQASLTGHLVLSSIHANDTVGAIFRLIDLGVEPFLVTSSLLGVLSQRLLRRTCSKCHQPIELPYRERMPYEEEMGEERTHFEVGEGCSSCAQTGFRGRIAAFELLTMNDNLRRMVLTGSRSDEIRAAAQENGMRSMLRDAMLKVQSGVTTPGEVLKKVFVMS